MTLIPARDAVLQAARHEVGVREHGANNRGQRVEEYQQHDSLPGGGYAWCADFDMFCLDVSGCHDIAQKLGQTASVDLLTHAAVNLGWWHHNNVTPLPGWLVVYTFSHTGIVVKDSGGGHVETIEGNTGPTGAVSDSKGGGDGVYQKIRSKYLVSGWVAIPGQVDDATVRRFRGDKDPRVVAQTNDESYWLWLRWWLGEGEFSKWAPHTPARRPKTLPKKIPDAWQKRKAAFVKARNAA